MNTSRRSALLAASAALCGVDRRAWAQAAAALPRVGYAWLFSDGPSGPYAEAFRQRMQELGWVDGRTVHIEFHDANGNAPRLDQIMQDMVQRRVDVIVAVCTPEANAARKFTQTIPIVMAATGDPVQAGLVHSLARPGTNVTGVSSMSLPLSARRVALLKEAAPSLTQATVLWNPVRRDNEPEVKIMSETGARLGMRIRSAQVRSREELATQLDALGWERDRAQAVMNAGDFLVTSERKAIVARAAALRIPGMYEDRVYVEAGGLMSYGPNLRHQHRRAAEYVDRLLKGAKAAELPIDQPTRFELVLNKRAAAAIGLTLPQSLYLQADEVIE